MWCVGRITVHLPTLQINESTALMSLKQFVCIFKSWNVKLSFCQYQIQSTGSEAVSAEQIILVFSSAGPHCPSREIKSAHWIFFWIQVTFPTVLGLWSLLALSLGGFKILDKAFFFVYVRERPPRVIQSDVLIILVLR